jgi:glycosyltransferase involved in cell wall biosynthesis
MIKPKEPLPSRILYIQYTNPAGYPPLEHSSRILAREGWEILFLGAGAFGANALSFPPHPNITVRQQSFCPPGWQQKLHYAQFCLWVVFWTLRWRPKWVYASDFLVCPIALLLTFLPYTRLIYHEHDSPEVSPQTPQSAFLQFCLTTRNCLAHRAAHCILPNQQRADSFDKIVANPLPSLCVWNCPAREEIAQAKLPWDGKTLWVLYHGSIVPDRLPLTVLHALSLLPDLVKLRVIGYQTIGHNDYGQTLQTHADHLGLTSRLELIGAMPRKQLLKYCQQSDIGLAFMPISTSDVNMNWMIGASNKPFDYLACGLPLVVSALPDWQQLYVEPGYGLSCDPNDPESIAKVLNWYLEHPVEMRSMGESGRQRILDEWNYETQFAGVQNSLGQAFKGQPIYLA